MIRCTNIIKEKEITPDPHDIYEGIYTFKDHIEERFNIIFYFMIFMKEYIHLKTILKKDLI